MALTAGATYAGAALPGRRAAAARSSGRATTVKVHAAAPKADFDPKQFRRELSKSPKYTRKFLKDEESAMAMEADGIGMVSKGAYALERTRPSREGGAGKEWESAD